MAKNEVERIHQDANSFARVVEQESEDLDYIINKIETGVDFIASQVKETIRQWKAGEVFHRETLDDLKLKFRLDTFSVDDGWGVFYMYPVRIRDQRNRLLGLIERIGTIAKPLETVPEAILRAEHAEWAKDLDMDMGVIFALQEIKRIFQITESMQHRLALLELVCRRRSSQITSPEWEPRGLL